MICSTSVAVWADLKALPSSESAGTIRPLESCNISMLGRTSSIVSRPVLAVDLRAFRKLVAALFSPEPVMLRVLPKSPWATTLSMGNV